MNKYTPGPWIIGERVKTARIDNARMIRPADHCNYEYGATAIIGTSEADACLIASAPELLEALKLIVQWREVIAKADIPAKSAILEDFDDACVVISKATGGME